MIRRMTISEVRAEMVKEFDTDLNYSEVWEKIPGYYKLPRQGMLVSVSGNKVTWNSSVETKSTLPATPEVIDLLINEGFPKHAELFFTTEKGIITKMLVILNT